jgi:hypothetical protein
MGTARTELVLLIVARAEDRLYHYLKKTFADVATIEIFRDRRFKNRRQAEAKPSVERRRGADRRRRDVSQALAVPGWALVKQPAADRAVTWDGILKPAVPPRS